MYNAAVVTKIIKYLQSNKSEKRIYTIKDQLLIIVVLYTIYTEVSL